ncbi:MAG: hypothetical protein M3421_02865 [Bacteroidota bacterium]|nr:hypothetical protein [Bacteroidota bacterium]
MLLHQIVPHWHHQLEVEHTHKSVAHSDNHSHHHDVPEKESSNKGLLDLFLEMYVHYVVSNEIIVTHESSVKELNVKKDVNTPISVNHYNIYINYDDEAEMVAVYHPPNTYFNPYLSSLDSRGPPTLG